VHAQIRVKRIRLLILVNDRHPSTNGLQPPGNVIRPGLALADWFASEDLADEEGETRAPRACLWVMPSARLRR
jgi:hypothetical protein